MLLSRFRGFQMCFGVRSKNNDFHLSFVVQINVWMHVKIRYNKLQVVSFQLLHVVIRFRYIVGNEVSRWNSQSAMQIETWNGPFSYRITQLHQCRNKCGTASRNKNDQIKREKYVSGKSYYFIVGV